MAKFITLTALLSLIFLSSLVYTKPNGVISCPVSTEGEYCQGNSKDFFVLLPFWPLPLYIFLATFPVAMIFLPLGRIFNLWYEYPFSSQPIAERNAVLPWLGWITLFVLIFLYSGLFVGVGAMAIRVTKSVIHKFFR